MFRTSFAYLLIILFATGFVTAQEKKPVPTRAEQMVSQVVEANSDFAFDLHRQLASEDKNKNKNLFVSPYSISNLFAMVWEGANGETAKEMAAVLKYADIAELQTTVSHGFQSLNRNFNNPHTPYKLQSLNAQWAEQSIRFQQKYQKVLSKQYGAMLLTANFRKNPNQERLEINKWVKTRTHQLIPNLIPPGSINRNTTFVLANATYFEARWKSPFKKRETKKGDFTLADGSKMKTFFMNKTKGNYRYARFTEQGKLAPHPKAFFGKKKKEEPKQETPPTASGAGGFQIIEIPYLSHRGEGRQKAQQSELAMVVLLPDKIDGLDDLEKTISGKNLNLWLNQMKAQPVELMLPRFKFESGYDLVPTMKSLGMNLAFTVEADLSGVARVSPNRPLYITFAVHKAFISVDEEGTVAAAATGFGGGGAFGAPPPKFRANHPFLFLIRDRNTGNILFLGRLMTP